MPNVQMEAFQKSLEQVREMGIGLGMDDKQIDQCMVSGLLAAKRTLITAGKPHRQQSEQPERPPKRVSRSGGRVRRYLRSLLKAFFTVFLVCCIVYQVANYSSSVQRVIMQYAEPILYPVGRYWRFMTLPLAKRIDLTGMYEDNCLIANPFNRPDPVNCDDYDISREVHNVSKITVNDFSNNFQGTSRILLVKGAHAKVPYTTLRTWYSKHKTSLAHSKNYVSGHRCGDITALGDLLQTHNSKDLREWKNCHAEWVSDTVNPSRLLRKLFFRPSFLPKASEVAITKTLIVDTPNTGSYTLNPAAQGFHNLYYLQGAGVRQLYLVPDNDCLHKARPITVIVEPGDIVYISRVHWRIESFPVKDTNNSDIGVGFLGSFM